MKLLTKRCSLGTSHNLNFEYGLAVPWFNEHSAEASWQTRTDGLCPNRVNLMEHLFDHAPGAADSAGRLGHIYRLGVTHFS